MSKYVDIEAREAKPNYLEEEADAGWLMHNSSQEASIGSSPISPIGKQGRSLVILCDDCVQRLIQLTSRSSPRTLKPAPTQGARIGKDTLAFLRQFDEHVSKQSSESVKPTVTSSAEQLLKLSRTPGKKKPGYQVSSELKKEFNPIPQMLRGKSVRWSPQSQRFKEAPESGTSFETTRKRLFETSAASSSFNKIYNPFETDPFELKSITGPQDAARPGTPMIVSAPKKFIKRTSTTAGGTATTAIDVSS